MIIYQRRLVMSVQRVLVCFRKGSKYQHNIIHFIEKHCAPQKETLVPCAPSTTTKPTSTSHPQHDWIGRNVSHVSSKSHQKCFSMFGRNARMKTARRAAAGEWRELMYCQCWCYIHSMTIISLFFLRLT